MEQIKKEILELHAEILDLRAELDLVKSGIFEKVICTEFHVVDQKGSVRISAHINPDETVQLALYDSAGQSRISSCIFENDDAAFQISDAYGEDRITAYDSEDFSVFYMSDSLGKYRFSVATYPCGCLDFSIFDTDEISRINASTAVDGYAKILLNTTESEEI